MKYLITGGCGFLGSNLSNEVLRRKEDLFIVDNLSRKGSEQNRDWIGTKGNFKFYQAHTHNSSDIEKIFQEVKPDVVFHLAGQVAMTTSLENPRLDFETNVIGGHNVLEAVRKHVPKAVVIYSSTNKVYGDFAKIRFNEEAKRYSTPDFENGFDESTPLDFHSPYGCSKGATDQYMLDYYRAFGVRTIVFRHSTIFGGRQFATYDQAWIGWFIQQAILEKQSLLKEPFTISGDGKQVRDILFASDLTECYFSALAHIDRTQGQAFNIGGGMANSLSLIELFDILEKELDVKLKYRKLPWRHSDQKVFVANIQKAQNYFAWTPKVNRLEGLREMINWVKSNA